MILRRFIATCVVVASLAAASSLRAQTAPAAPAAPPDSGSTVVQDASGNYLEWGIVAIGVGVAVFAVCRSSRRN
jgi:hypothetical protein